MLVLATLASCTNGAGQSWESSTSANQIFSAANAARTQISSADIVASDAAGARMAELGFAGPGTAKVTGVLNGAPVGAVILHGHVYVRSAKLWQQVLGSNPQTAALVARIDDHWVDLGSSGAALYPGYDELTSSNFLHDCLVLGPHGTLTKAGVSTVNGYRAIRIDDRGDVAGSTPGRWYIATDAPHYFLRFISSGPRNPGGGAPPGLPARCTGLTTTALTAVASASSAGTKVDFTKINQPVDVTAPAGAIDIQALMP